MCRQRTCHPFSAYEGIWHHTWLKYDFVGTKGDVSYGPKPTGYYGRSDVNISINEYEARVSVEMNSGNKPIYIYTEFSVNEDGEPVSIKTLARKTKLKNMTPYAGELHTLIQNYEFDSTMQKYNFDYYARPKSPPEKKIDKAYSGVSISKYIDTQTSTQNALYFKTKEEALEYDYTEFVNEHIFPSDRYAASINTENIYEDPNYNRYGGYYTRTNKSLSGSAKRIVKITDNRGQ